MRHSAFFDDGLFFMSFSVALGFIALIIPARGGTCDRIRTAREYIDVYGATDTRLALAESLNVNPVRGAGARVDLAEVYPRSAGRTGR